MPTYSEVLTSIENAVDTLWPHTPVAYDNVEALDYTDANRPQLSVGSAPYIAVCTKFSEAFAAEVGQGAIIRTWGFLEIAFNTREHQGSKINATNLELMAQIFEYQVIDGIVFKEMSVMDTLIEKGWYVTPALIRFYFNR